jgi:hypothetical protein
MIVFGRGEVLDIYSAILDNYLSSNRISIESAFLNLNPTSDISTTPPWPESASDRRSSAKLVPTFLRIDGATWSA